MTTPHPSRRALVTGAAQGIGLATCARLRLDGCVVVGADLVAPADGRSPSCDEFYTVDVSDPADVERLREQAGAIDIVVNSAGVVGPNQPIWEVPFDLWERTIAVNLTGTFNMMRSFIPAMRAAGWGRVINIASIAGKEGNPNLAAYSASKAGVIGLTKAVAKEVATDGVLVHSIAPAVIATPMNASTDSEVLAYMLSKIPMGRAGTADEVASLVGWLASEACSFTTGACHDISGGRATY